MRIISLVPSLTELLYDLGLEEEVVGITKFCVRPEHWFRSKTRIGGTKDIDLERIHSLRPGLIIANKEENVKEQVGEIAGHYPVWVSDVADLPDAIRMIATAGMLTGRSKVAGSLIARINNGFSALEAIPAAEGPRTAYLIWKAPWMAAGGGTFIHDMLRRCGFVNIFRELPRYPAIEPRDLADAGCQLVLLSSEPYPFREKHIAEIRDILPGARVELVNGEFFSWYGSRLQEAPGYFRDLQNRVGL